MDLRETDESKRTSDPHSSKATSRLNFCTRLLRGCENVSAYIIIDLNISGNGDNSTNTLLNLNISGNGA